MDRMLRDIDSGRIVSGLMMDLSKAFDTVNHDLLLKKLEMYGMIGLTNQMIASYLSDRNMYVHVNGCDSDEHVLNNGVPQGHSRATIVPYPYE